MENNENINNDPDVNMKSWIFVENAATTNKSELNSDDNIKNHTSSVQELIEEDLGSNESSCDSDGISVISETEDNSPDCCTCLPKINTQDNGESNMQPNVIETTDDNIELDDNNIEIIENNLDIIEDNSEIPETLKQIEKLTVINSKIHTNHNKYTLATTVAGVCIFITYLVSNYNVKSPTYLNEKVLDTNYDHSNTDVQFTDDIIDESNDMDIWHNYEINNDTCDSNFDLTELKTDFNAVNNLVQSFEKINTDIASSVTMKSKKFKQINKSNGKEHKKTIYQNVNNGDNKEKPINKQNKHISSNNNNKKNKNKNLINNSETRTLKIKENYLNKKDKYLTKKEKYLKKLEKHISNLENKLRKIHQRIKKESNDNKFKDLKHKKFKKENIKKTLYINATGEWYQKMSSGRSEIRHKEKMSEWMFDRSKMRSKLRDKASWYFNRGNGREEFRSSENIYSKKRKGYKSYRY